MAKITKEALLARVQELEAKEQKRKVSNQRSLEKLRRKRTQQGLKRVKIAVRDDGERHVCVKNWLRDLQQLQTRGERAREKLSYCLAQLSAEAEELLEKVAPGEDSTRPIKEFETTVREDSLELVRKSFHSIAAVYRAWPRLTAEQRETWEDSMVGLAVLLKELDRTE